MAEEILLENYRVKVTRVTLGPGETIEPTDRSDRVISYLSEACVDRHDHGTGDKVRHFRAAGDSLWREASRHAVTNSGCHPVTVLITEIK